ncbi:hypothetical protein GCM10010221_59510 [Streptomyces parvus]|nr:hypothetical protein GCM10010221_59510 [Streptomyces parvus]
MRPETHTAAAHVIPYAYPTAPTGYGRAPPQRVFGSAEWSFGGVGEYIPAEPGGSAYGEGWSMDLFDGELGGRDDQGLDTGGGWSWCGVITVGIFILLAVLISWIFGLVGRIF